MNSLGLIWWPYGPFRTIWDCMTGLMDKLGLTWLDWWTIWDWSTIGLVDNLLIWLNWWTTWNLLDWNDGQSGTGMASLVDDFRQAWMDSWTIKDCYDWTGDTIGILWWTIWDLHDWTDGHFEIGMTLYIENLGLAFKLMDNSDMK